MIELRLNGNAEGSTLLTRDVKKATTGDVTEKGHALIQESLLGSARHYLPASSLTTQCTKLGEEPLFTGEATTASRYHVSLLPQLRLNALAVRLKYLSEADVYE